MATLTTTLSLRKPGDSDSVQHTLDLNNNYDLIDALFNPTTGHKHTGAGTNAPVATMDETLVIYDPTEAATNDTLSGTSKLINNMNRLRYWITQVSGVSWTTAIGTSLSTHVASFHANSFTTPNLTLGTANAAGAANTVIRSDATILAFDGTNPAGVGTAAVVGSQAVATRRDHVHAHGSLGTIANAHAAADITNAVATNTPTTHTKQYAVSAFSVAFSATPTFDWNNSNIQYMTLTGNITGITFSNPIDGARYVLILTQDGTGGRTIVWPAAVHWSGGTAPTLSAASKIDLVSLFYRGGVYYATIIGDYS